MFSRSFARNQNSGLPVCSGNKCVGNDLVRLSEFGFSTKLLPNDRFRVDKGSGRVTGARCPEVIGTV